MSPRFLHLDSAESVFFARELEYVKSKTYDIKYPGLKGRLYIPVSNEVPSGMETVTYRQYDRVGKAKNIQPGATDLPRVDVKGQEFTRPVRWYGDEYGWNLIEIRQSQITGRSLDSRRASAARRAWEEIVDEVACFGDPDVGITEGFLNSSQVDVDTATGTWSTQTADVIIDDIAEMYENTADDTKGMEQPDTLLVPDAQYTVLATRPRSDYSDTTVLQFVLQNFPYLKTVEPWYRLKGAGSGAVDRGMLYLRSPEAVEQEIPNEFEQLPVFQRGLNFDVACIGATAGTQFYYPRSARYIDGI